jgi:hypothetical protein
VGCVSQPSHPSQPPRLHESVAAEEHCAAEALETPREQEPRVAELIWGLARQIDRTPEAVVARIAAALAH